MTKRTEAYEPKLLEFLERILHRVEDIEELLTKGHEGVSSWAVSDDEDDEDDDDR